MAENAWIVACIGELVDYARKHQQRELETDLLVAFFSSGLQQEVEAEEHFKLRSREFRDRSLRSHHT